MREALNGRPAADRTRRDYQRVINAYRGIYYGAPTSTKADPSVVAVAEILVEMGRRFDDDKILKDAIGQYRFLRREYPGSKYRCDALFTIGEIYSDDLNDPEQARATFQEFLKRYPHNRLVDDAQQAIADLDQQAEVEKKAAAATTDKGGAGKNATSSKPAETPAQVSATAPERTPEQQSGRLPRVTGIRHWSTPDYTRVAIDLESEVKFGSQRIAHPDRIFFDLRDTKLASTLKGKSFDVDDGFLKKIRVAQFQPGRTRVVLEVEDLSSYDAFLLPDPYRLIIDIHGKSLKLAQAKRGKGGDVEAPPKAEAKAEERDDADAKMDTQAPARTGDEDPSGESKSVVSSEPMAPMPKGKVKSEMLTASAKVPAGVKKVIVEADDDAPPAKASSSKTSRRSRPSLKSATPTEANPEDKSSAEATAKTAVGDGESQGKLSRQEEKDATAASFDIHEASPTARGDRSLIRALGLKIGKIVIDPGHGGHDTGTIGPNGLDEKDLVLEVGRRLGKLLESRLGAQVVYTRKDDTFIPLETRTAIANQQRADLFISIHANSSDDPAARGVETYYLNFTSSPEALEVAARENAVSEKSIYELQDLVKKIALKEKIEESREFAGDVQESLHSGLAAKSPGIRNRGVKKAPFIVLIGANMPSILAEISFVSNPGDEHRLETAEYRQRIAESLYKGIAKYVNGLSGVKVASKMEHGAGQ